MMGAVIYPIPHGPVRALVILQVTADRWQVADYGRACPTGRRARWHGEGLPFERAQSVAVTAFRRFGIPICIKRLGAPYRPYRPGGAA